MNRPDTEVLASWGPSNTWTIGWHLADRAAHLPDRPFLAIGTDPADTFRQAHEHATRLASRLAGTGIGPGDFVLVMAPTTKATVYGWFALSLLGAVDVPLNPAYRGQTLVHGVNLPAARVLLADSAALHRLYEVAARLHTLQTVVLIDDSPAPAPPPEARFQVVRLADLPEHPYSPAAPRHSDLSTVLYTSGTTGPAKGVMMTHAQTHTIARECIEGLRITGEDVFYCFHPLFHMAGRFGAVYSALVAGCPVVLDPVFDPATWIDRIRACNATVSIAHGPMIEMIHRQPRRPDDADNPLRALLAAPLPAAIGADFERRFAVRALETWGMTEVTACCWRPYDSELRPGSAGRPRDDLVEIAIVDPETDEVLPPGQVGEITVRPRHPWIIMQGYFGMPEQTVRAWRNLRFHSGDAGYLDADGHLYFVDRLGDRIRRKAENISSYDIEYAAATYPGVLECAAVGVPASHSEDEVKLYLRCSDNSAVDLRDLFTHLVANLPHSMVPRYIELVDELPRTPTDKIRKQALRERGVTATTWDYKAAGLSIRQISQQLESASPREGTA